MVERHIEDHAHIDGIQRGAQIGERAIAAKIRIDAVEIGHIVAMIAARCEDRVQVERVHAKRCEIVQLVRNADQIAAVEIQITTFLPRQDRLAPSFCAAL
jgi:hypothetical protein